MNTIGDKCIGIALLVIGILLLIRAIGNIKYTKKTFMDYLRIFGLAVTTIITGIFLLLVN